MISYSAPHLGREKDDYVPYIDNKGVKHVAERGLIDWEERRYCIAKDMMAAFLSNSNVAVHGYSAEEHASNAVLYADALIAELKKGGNQ